MLKHVKFNIFSEPKHNGDHRTSTYMHQHIQSDKNNPEQSWIYALCMRCRVEYNTPSWEPPHWQKICPYPLCPSFRQFANILAIILIGK